MSKGTSWPVLGTDPGTDGYRIRLALQNGDVRWDPRTSYWLGKHFDNVKYSVTVVNSMLWQHVKAGGRITGQRNVKGMDFDVWFYVNLVLDGQERFIKFAIEPEDDDYPGLLICSTHPPH